ncbi:MAG: hypothetical protein AVDCRST_MAG66-45 [uncultured Pseudonocardia sp.]|uniref:Uncharacterized protein n=1 Tax=uncultured Pseudonocardia sp. TaxID=211455 RepID=A0A6J4NA02_9PSEU|nr:MAG: hypothetical protein AVDCRST_MAG66-45 [uncultured Pseudonocardia sp.]
MSETNATSSTDQDRVTRDYVGELAYHLARAGLDGQRVGEVMAEVEAHVHATGEPARVAFGPPREYARRWAPDVPPQERRRRRLRVLAFCSVIAPAAAVLGWLVGQGVRAGHPPVSSDLAAGGLLLALVGAIGLVALIVPWSRNQIIDPRTGRTWSGTRSALLGTCLVLTVLLVTGLVLVTVF